MCTGLEVLMLAGTAVSTISAIEQADAAKDRGRALAQMAEKDAALEREAAGKRAESIRRAGRAQQSEARAALSASGVEVSAGTPVRIQREIGRLAEEDAMEELLYGSRAGERLEDQASMQRRAGRNAQRAGYLDAGGSVLSGGARAYDSWLRNPRNPGNIYT